jgi:hypothetical protein
MAKPLGVPQIALRYATFRRNVVLPPNPHIRVFFDFDISYNGFTFIKKHVGDEISEFSVYIQ